VVGIDPTEKCIELAKQHVSLDEALSEKVEYRHTSLEHYLIKEENPKFDVVCCSEVLEHVENPSDFVNNLARAVKPEGYLFVTTMARTPEAFLMTIVLGEYLLGLLPKGTHEWEKYLHAEEVEAMFNESGVIPLQSTGVGIVNPLTFEMGEVGCRRVNYMMIGKKL